MLELFLSSFLLLQTTHPCDLPDQGVPTKGNAVGWCHDMKDDGGLTLSSLAFIININGSPLDIGTQNPIGNPSASGLYYFQYPLPGGYGRGSYPVFVTAYTNEGASLPSNVVTWQIGGPPNKPVKPRIP